MHTKRKALLTIVLILTTVLAVALVTALDQPTYAKGVVKSSGGKGSSAKKHDSGSKGSSASSEKSHSKSQVSRSSSKSAGSRINRSRPSREDLKRKPNDDLLRVDRTTTQPKIRRRSPLYRKDYAEIGDIWRSRNEKRESASSRSRENYRRHDRWYYDRDWHVQVHYYDRFRYRHYCYEYRPAYSFPSVYCYYHCWFPPYIYARRVVVVSHLCHPRVLVEIPIIINRDDDYYLADRIQRGLMLVLRDIRYAWERSDPDLIMDHARRDSRIAVYLKQEYSYSVEREDYYEMTRDAMAVIRTKRFEFDRVRKRETGEYVAYGKHTYYDEDVHMKTVYVSYTLERSGNEWYIIEVGCSPDPI